MKSDACSEMIVKRNAEDDRWRREFGTLCIVGTKRAYRR